MSAPNPSSDDGDLRAAVKRSALEQAGDTAALERVVLGQWQAHGPAWQGETALAGGLGASGSGRRPGWGPTSGVLALAVLLLVAVWWAQRPDPALRELMQIDVLSQIAIDEM